MACCVRKAVNLTSWSQMFVVRTWFFSSWNKNTTVSKPSAQTQKNIIIWNIYSQSSITFIIWKIRVLHLENSPSVFYKSRKTTSRVNSPHPWSASDWSWSERWASESHCKPDAPEDYSFSSDLCTVSSDVLPVETLWKHTITRTHVQSMESIDEKSEMSCTC